MRAVRILSPLLLASSVILTAAPAAAPSSAGVASPEFEQCLYEKGCVTNGSGAWLCPQQGDYDDCLLSTGG